MWADVDDVWEDFGKASTDGGNVHAYDISSGNESAGVCDNALSGGSQHAIRVIDPSSAPLAAVEQKVVKDSPWKVVVDSPEVFVEIRLRNNLVALRYCSALAIC